MQWWYWNVLNGRERNMTYSLIKQKVINFFRQGDWIQIFMCVCVCYIRIDIDAGKHIYWKKSGRICTALLLRSGHFLLGLFPVTFTFFCILQCMWIAFKIRKYVDFFITPHPRVPFLLFSFLLQAWVEGRPQDRFSSSFFPDCAAGEIRGSEYLA